MGYCITMVDSKFFIAAENKYEAYKTLKNKFDSSEGVRKARCLEDILEVYDYTPETDECDNIYSLEYTGEKLWDEAELFDALAPFVQSGSFIEMMGEDGEQWRWAFKDGKFKEVQPKIEWPDDD